MRVFGADRFKVVAAKLKKAGHTGIYRSLAKAIRVSTKDAVDDVKRTVESLQIDGQGSGGRGGGARARSAHALSKRRKISAAARAKAQAGSGLRASVSRAIRTHIRASGRPTAAVRIKVERNLMPPDQRKLPGHMEKGSWRHPVFGNQQNWVAQTSTPNWFKGTLRKHGPAVRREIDRQVTAAIRSI
ncbi:MULTISPECIES: hypothetical protein [unclassified Crossiella]|uniref:hypothetical protein n=1 Tax=unclassified Crossiella TaxID=2620835 RepID=UPI001FFF3C4F|nr:MULTISPECIES: hypothetical protein [unclassified Crossiella]MCK2242144.1 hypothetical protein [Crossiella sp. S99.2]MCK2256047.1 hypothetical protein [Crossiella sp. S99.1]